MTVTDLVTLLHPHITFGHICKNMAKYVGIQKIGLSPTNQVNWMQNAKSSRKENEMQREGSGGGS